MSYDVLKNYIVSIDNINHSSCKCVVFVDAIKKIRNCEWFYAKTTVKILQLFLVRLYSLAKYPTLYHIPLNKTIISQISRKQDRNEVEHELKQNCRRLNERQTLSNIENQESRIIIAYFY